ncbi:MAG: NAD(+) synthase [Betaproteobacteria bacterium]|nr:NAD(+) synthase [Betaproteobacteria bacterium]
MSIGKHVFGIDYAAEATRIGVALKDYLRESRKKGIVVGMSGGIDSSATAALAVHALGPSRVFGVFMPEADSDPESLRLGNLLAAHLGIRAETEDIAPALAALKCYERRNAAVARVISEFTAEWKFKIVLSGTDTGALNFFSVVARAPDGREVRERLPLDAYLAIVAATNFKQRIRKTVEYHWADRLNFAVAGTPNRLEDDQGFFVKQGDGAADIKPIAHLYKTQVYAMARHLGLPDAICNRQPTTDTYSLPQGQDEFYFKLPYAQFDLCLYGKDRGIAPLAVAEALGIGDAQVEHVYRDIDAKRNAARYLHAAAARIGA